jgi:glutathione S-transferase
VDDLVLDQSLDIMYWAISKSDPDGWGSADDATAQAWIAKNDGPFKVLLDQYKYPNRFPELDQAAALQEALQIMLLPMEKSLQATQYLMSDKMTWVDVAIFPFIRQFSMVDANKFEQLPISATKRWLARHLESDLFRSVMHKYPVWRD